MKAPRARLLLSTLAMVGLGCVGVFFLLAAAYAFVTGFYHLLIFFGGMLFYGSVTMELETFPEKLGRTIFDLIGPVLFAAFGALCLAAAKRMRLREHLAHQADDVRAPVIYLRSFRVDKRLARRPLAIGRVFSLHTEEEQLVEALREIGPVIAIGRPGERLPRLGAQRVYLEDKEWQPQILSWFRRASLAVIHIPAEPTEGLTWEIEQSLSVVPLERLVFMVSRDVKSLNWLKQTLRGHGLADLQLTLTLGRAPYGSQIAGIVHFTSGQAEVRALAKPPFLHRPFWSPLVPVYRSALAPVTRRITGSWRSLAPGYADATIAAVWVTFCAVVIAVAMNLRRTDPLGREVMICGQRMLKQLPNEARTFADRRDEAALFAWMQSHIQDGLRYIPDDVALARANVVGRLLAIADPAECAALADGAITEPAFTRMFVELGRQDHSVFSSWCGYQEKALLASLNSEHAAAFPVSESDATAAFAALYQGLSRKEISEFTRILANYENSSAEDHCWSRRVMFHGLETVPEPSRTKLARVALGQDIDK